MSTRFAIIIPVGAVKALLSVQMGSGAEERVGLLQGRETDEGVRATPEVGGEIP